jgi:hypothetical protein
MQDPTDIDELIARFAQANPDGVDPTRVLNKGAYGGAGDTNIRASIRQFGQTIGYTGSTGPTGYTGPTGTVSVIGSGTGSILVRDSNNNVYYAAPTGIFKAPIDSSFNFEKRKFY